ncbi:MAG: ribosome-associated translation inhibitor RaiA [Bacteriovoracaceae bacterium]
MNVTVNFHQMEPTPAIKEMVEKKSAKLKKFFDGGFDLKWTLEAGKDGHHAHALLASDGFTLNADSVKEDMYKTFDDVVSKLEKQLVKKKTIAKDHIHHNRKKMDLGETDEFDEEEL